MEPKRSLDGKQKAGRKKSDPPGRPDDLGETTGVRADTWVRYRKYSVDGELILSVISQEILPEG